MKKFAVILCVMLGLVAAFVSCSQPNSGSGPVQEPFKLQFKLNGSISLDYANGCLTIESNAPQKSLVTLSSGGKTYSSKALGGKTRIQIVGEGRLINSSEDGGKIYYGILKCESFDNFVPVSFSYYPAIYVEQFDGYSSTLSRISDFNKEKFFPDVKSNYGDAKCEIEWDYFYTEYLPAVLDDSFSGIKIENGIEGVKEFVKDTENVGLYVVGKCKLQIKTADGSVNSTNTYCSWSIVNVDNPDAIEVTTKNNINFTASYKKNGSVIDSDGTLKWYADGTECGSGKLYTLRKEDTGKKLTCEFIPNALGASRISYEYSKKLFAPIKSATVSYNGNEVYSGKTLDKDAIKINMILNCFGEDLNPNDAVCLPEINEQSGTKEEDGKTIPLFKSRIGTYEEWAKKTYDTTGWENVYVKVSGYEGLEEPFCAQMLVPVKYELTDELMPSLSTDVNNISYGKVKFGNLSGNMEYKLNDKDGWKDLKSDTEIESAAGNRISIRLSATGAFGSDFYVMESDEREITVKDENIGKMHPTSGIDISFASKELEIKLVSSENRKYTFEAVVSDTFSNLTGSKLDYRWSTDNNAAGVESNYSYLNDKKIFIVDASNWYNAKYNVTLKLYINNTPLQLAETSFIVK